MILHLFIRRIYWYLFLKENYLKRHLNIYVNEKNDWIRSKENWICIHIFLCFIEVLLDRPSLKIFKINLKITLETIMSLLFPRQLIHFKNVLSKFKTHNLYYLNIYLTYINLFYLLIVILTSKEFCIIFGYRMRIQTFVFYCRDDRSKFLLFLIHRIEQRSSKRINFNLYKKAVTL